MISKMVNVMKEKTSLFAAMIGSMGIVNTLKVMSVNVMCTGNTGETSSTGKVPDGADLLWNNSGADDLIVTAIAFYTHWWWVAAVIEAVLWVVFTWFHQEKPAEMAKRAVFITIGAFILAIAYEPVKATIESIANMFIS